MGLKKFLPPTDSCNPGLLLWQLNFYWHQNGELLESFGDFVQLESLLCLGRVEPYSCVGVRRTGPGCSGFLGDFSLIRAQA